MGYVFHILLLILTFDNIILCANGNTSKDISSGSSNLNSTCNLGIRRRRAIFRNLRKLMYSGSYEYGLPALAPFVLDEFDIE